MFRKAFLTTTLVFLLLPLAAVALTEQSAQTFALDSGGRISLENINGDVVVEAWDRAEVSVEAVKNARTAEGLAELEIEIDARGDRIHIETRYPDGRNRRNWNPGSVEYTLRVPRDARIDEIELVNGSLDVGGLTGDVRASLVNGQVTAHGLTGDVEISTVNGSLDVELAALASDSSVELSSVNGTVNLSVPGDAGADIEASTVHGRIRNDFGLEVERGEYVGSSLEGDVGGGGAQVALSSVNGTIEIRQAN